MTNLAEDHSIELLVPGGLAELEPYDRLTAERRARVAAEAIAGDLARLIASEYERVAAAERALANLRTDLERERSRADTAQRQLDQVMVYGHAVVPPRRSRWQRFKAAFAR